MFFVVSKILTYLFHPLVWIVVLLVIALFFSRKPKKIRRELLAAFVLLVAFSNTFLVNQVVSLWAIRPVAVHRKFDVGIVLGGTTVTYNARYHRVTYRGNIDRLLQAVEMYKRGKIRKIMVTGASGNLMYRQVKEGRLLHDFLVRIGIPEKDILTDTLAENTHENAVYAKKILLQHPQLHSVLLFTSALHMRRALACFRHEEIKSTPYVTNLLNTKIRWNPEYLFIPDAANFLVWNGMIHEVFGYLVYWIVGYI